MFSLILLRFVVDLKSLLEFFHLFLFYQKKKILFYIDTLFFRTYFFQSAHRIHKKHRLNNQDIFGHTFCSAIAKITKECSLTESDTIYDVGCGTGRTSFWFHYLTNSHVLGVDRVQPFIDKANRVKKMAHTEKVSFSSEDFLKMDYSKATVIYFYGTSFSDKMIRELVGVWASLKPGTRLITTSYPLSDYDPSFVVKKSFECSYPWGKCELFLQEKR